MNYSIREMKEEDWTAVSEIYLDGINTKIATFQSEAPSYEEWDKGHMKNARLVVYKEDTILGWAALSPTSSRCVYKGVAEVSIYIGKEYRNIGVGTLLLEQIIKASEENGIWTLQSGIIRENARSIALHEKSGFRQIGIREKVAKMSNGKWHDVVLMERRSKIVGID